MAELIPLLRITHPNVLLLGPVPQANRALDQMLPHLRTPLASWTPGVTNLEVDNFQTLVIRDVDTLSPTQQEHLLALILRTEGDVQIVSTAATPLLPLVKDGLFMDGLYYRLNVLLVELARDY